MHLLFTWSLVVTQLVFTCCPPPAVISIVVDEVFKYKINVWEVSYIKVLSLHEGVHAELSVLSAPCLSSPVVPHHHAFLHPGVHVEGDVSGPAYHQVDPHPATQGVLVLV